MKARVGFCVALITALLMLSGLSACTAQQAYSSAQGWQRNQCQKIVDKSEYDRCMSNAGESYESHKSRPEAGGR